MDSKCRGALLKGILKAEKNTVPSRNNNWVYVVHFISGLSAYIFQDYSLVLLTIFAGTAFIACYYFTPDNKYLSFYFEACVLIIGIYLAGWLIIYLVIGLGQKFSKS